MTTPATPPPPAPVPPELPEGYHIIPKDWLRTNLLPDDAIFTFSGNPWKPSHLRGFQLQSWEIETGGRFYATRAEPQVSQIADAREGQVASRVIPDSLKIGAPQHEQAGESLPSATIESTSSESSGDVHLANALAEVERLKGDKAYFVSSLAENKRPFSDKFSADVIAGQLETIKRLESVVAKERTKALAQEGLIEKLNRQLEEIALAALGDKDANPDGPGLPSLVASIVARAETAEKEADCLRSTLRELKRNVVEVILPNSKNVSLDFGQLALWQICIDEVDRALATPSPAPVVGKTNPPEISSPVVDGGEKDSVGPTINYDAHPETDAFMTHIDDSSIDLDQVAAQMGGFEAERNFARQAIQIMLASARPHPTENPTMFEAWKRGKAALTPPVAGGEG